MKMKQHTLPDFLKKFSARARGWINDTDNGKNDKQSVFFFWAPTWRVWHESYPGGLRNDDVVADSRRSTKWNPSTETLSQCVCLTNPQQTKSPPLVTTPHHQLWTFYQNLSGIFPLIIDLADSMMTLLTLSLEFAWKTRDVSTPLDWLPSFIADSV